MSETNSSETRSFFQRRSRIRIAILVACTVFFILLITFDSRLASLLRNSFLLAAGTAAISLPAGSFLGLLLMRTDLPGRRLFLSMIVGGLFIPLYVHCAAWSAGFGQLGWFPFVGDPPKPLLDSWRGAIWIHSVAAIPWVALIVGFASRNVNRDLEEYALLDAAPITVFRKVTLRLIRPALFASLLWIALMTTGEMTVSDIFRIRTFVEEVYLNSQLDRFSLAPILRPWTNEFEPQTIGIGGQLSVVVLYSMIALALLTELTPTKPRTGPPLIFRLGKSKPFAVLLVALFVVTVFGIPVGNLVYKAGMQNIPLDESTQSVWKPSVFFENFGSVPSKYGDSFVWTTLLGLSAATIALVISFPAAWIARNGTWARSIPTIAIVTFCLAVPGPTVAQLIIAVLDQPGIPLFIELYDRTLLAPALAIAIRILPLTILFLWHSFHSINRHAVEHAELEGAGMFRRMYMFGWQQNHAAVVAAALLALIFAVGDLTASNLVMPPRVDPLSRLIFGFIHSGVDDQVAILSLCNVLFMLPLIAAFIGMLAVLSRRASNF